MSGLLLPATTYRPGSEQARRETLNTIIEDEPQYTQRFLASWSPTKVTILSPVFSDDGIPTPKAEETNSRRIKPQTHVETDFDDLYDITESESEEVQITIAGSPKRKHKRYPSISIPSPSAWPTIQKFQQKMNVSSAVAPVQPSPLYSPSAKSLALIASRNLRIPSSSAAPSLDGSLTSDDLSSLSCPSTPDIESRRSDEDEWGAPIQLAPAAMETLQRMSAEDNAENQMHELPTSEMQQAAQARPLSVNIIVTPVDGEFEPISAISVPSPGGFFASLDSQARQTWVSSPTAEGPSTSTAESFYAVPWRDDRTVEQNVSISDDHTEGPPTARRISFEKQESTAALWPVHEVFEYNEDYPSELAQTAGEHIDRTSLWLNSQETYLEDILDSGSLSGSSSDATTIGPHSRQSSAQESLRSLTSPAKSVRFAHSAPDNASFKSSQDELPSPEEKDPTFVEGFRYLHADTQQEDAFLHRKTRTDALTLDRRCLFDAHLKQLAGQYELTSPMRPSPQRPVSNFYADDANDQKEVIARAQKERQALDQIRPMAWNLEATKLLNGGTLLTSPVGKFLNRHPGSRVLDLGGQATCDWAWQVALEHPNTTVHTVYTPCSGQNPNQGLERPLNHRQQCVPNLWTLPFPSGHFDIVSARSLHVLLKTRKPSGQQAIGRTGKGLDEYDLCLKECMRVLKPGGYLEFAVLDADLLAPGPRGRALSVEFAFNLRTRGYDPNPTKSFLPRLRKCGFAEVKRAWVVLPMARVPQESWRAKPEGENEGLGLGSTVDASYISGMVGAWAWERWIMKLNVEMGRKGERVLEGVADVIDEGTGAGAAWRYLSGWARKDF